MEQRRFVDRGCWPRRSWTQQCCDKQKQGHQYGNSERKRRPREGADKVFEKMSKKRISLEARRKIPRVVSGRRSRWQRCKRKKRGRVSGGIGVTLHRGGHGRERSQQVSAPRRHGHKNDVWVVMWGRRVRWPAGAFTCVVCIVTELSWFEYIGARVWFW